MHAGFRWPHAVNSVPVIIAARSRLVDRSGPQMTETSPCRFVRCRRPGPGRTREAEHVSFRGQDAMARATNAPDGRTWRIRPRAAASSARLRAALLRAPGGFFTGTWQCASNACGASGYENGRGTAITDRIQHVENARYSRVPDVRQTCWPTRSGPRPGRISVTPMNRWRARSSSLFARC